MYNIFHGVIILKFSNIDLKVKIYVVVSIILIFKLITNHYFILDVHATHTFDLFITFIIIQIMIIYLKKSINCFYKKYLCLISLGMWIYFILFAFL